MTLNNKLTSQNFSDLQVWWSEYSNCYAERTWQNYQALLSEVVLHGAGGPVVDIGCGYGFLVECARQWGILSIGLEGAPFALAEARRRHPQADIRSWEAGTPLGLAPNSVGTFVVNEVVDHITLDHDQQLFADIQRALRPSGRVIVKSPSKDNRFEMDKGHITFFTPSEFRRFLEAVNLEVVSQPYVPQPLMGTSRLGWFAMRMIAKFYRLEKWAARIDLVARKPAV